MNKWFLLLFLIIFSVPIFAQNSTDHEYQGYRIFVTDLSVYQKKSDWLRIAYKAHNTGRKPLRVSLKSPQPTMEINFDSSLEKEKLMPFAEQIRLALRRTKIDLQAGESSGLDYVKVNIDLDKTGLHDEYAAVEINIVNKKKVVKQPRPAPSLIIPKAKHTPEPEMTQPVVTVQPEDRKSQPSKIEETEEEIKPQYEYDPKQESKPIKGSGFSTNTSVSKTDFQAIEKEKAMCPDLILDKVKVLDQSKRWLTIEYQITNVGKGSAALMGKEGHERDNVAIKAFMSGSPRLSRGAINIGGEFIRGGKSVLAPGESHIGKIKLDISSKTRYTPVVILSLDAFQTFRECDRTNNNNHIVVE